MSALHAVTLKQPVSPEKPVILQVDNLVKRYGSRTVVDGVSFKVHEGEVVGLLGSNGAGKTTSFRMACGLIPPNSGTVRLNGLEVTDWPMYRRAKEGKMGYLPQDRSTFGSLTTEQNLYAAMEFLGIERSIQKKRCTELLNKFRLTDVRRTVVGTGGTGGLSGGERRRLEIARALLSHPKILLLDEPFANVDPVTVEEIQDVIKELSNEGIAILITDHNVDETLDITHRSYVIHNGKVLCSGTPLEVLDDPEAIRVYFGSNVYLIRERILKNLQNSGADFNLSPTNTNNSPVMNTPPVPESMPVKNRNVKQGEMPAESSRRAMEMPKSRPEPEFSVPESHMSMANRHFDVENLKHGSRKAGSRTSDPSFQSTETGTDHQTTETSYPGLTLSRRPGSAPPPSPKKKRSFLNKIDSIFKKK
ncbi:MAG: LPS export ABC transporter ATP-binding protein [Thermoguttaceae bacterium]|nr:LPS export ABC transporter ATP-binding protein [Thermoguttaceae bacterium]